MIGELHTHQILFGTYEELDSFGQFIIAVAYNVRLTRGTINWLTHMNTANRDRYIASLSVASTDCMGL